MNLKQFLQELNSFSKEFMDEIKQHTDLLIPIAIIIGLIIVLILRSI